MSSKLTAVEYHQVLNQVTAWLYNRTKNPQAQQEAKQFIEVLDSRTNTKEELIDLINQKLQRLQSKPITTTDSLKWIIEKKDILQNILAKFESKRANDKTFENSLSIVAREGFTSLKKMLNLDLRPGAAVDAQLYVDDVLRIKKSLTELRDLIKDRNQENLYHEEESLLYIFLMEFLILLEIMEKDPNAIKGIITSGMLFLVVFVCFIYVF